MGWTVLVVGHPRSGTSALDQSLEDEFGVDFLWGRPGIDSRYPLMRNPQGYKQRADVHQLCLAEGLNARLERLPLSRQREIVDRLFSILGPIGRQILGIKEHGLLWVLDALWERLPGLLVLCAWRPREATVLSCQRFVTQVFGVQVSRERLSREWDAYQEEFLRQEAARPRGLLWYLPPGVPSCPRPPPTDAARPSARQR